MPVKDVEAVHYHLHLRVLASTQVTNEAQRHGGRCVSSQGSKQAFAKPAHHPCKPIRERLERLAASSPTS